MKDRHISQLRTSINKKMSRYTQKEIAKKLGFTQSYISKILNGKRVPKDVKNILDRINSELANSFSKN